MDLTDDEVMLLMVFGGLAAFFLWRLTRGIVVAVPFNSSDTPAVVLAGTLYVILLGIWIALATLAPENVRSSLGIQALFVAAAAVVLGAGTSCLTLLGLDPIADPIERGNRAAGIATVGLWLAIAVCTIAANIGEGESVATTFTPMAIALLLLLAIVLAFARVTQGFEPIAVDRCIPSALRLAALLIFCSALLARAAAGDWVSLASTIVDFVHQLPALAALSGLAVLVEWRANRHGYHDDVSTGSNTVLPIVIYAAIAVGDLVFIR